MKYTTKAVQYAEEVIAGKILAGRNTRLACERFLNDLQRAADGWKYYYSPDEVEWRCELLEEMPHVKGRWAAKGQTLDLQGWQCFLMANLFGWLQVKDDLRRFREAYVRIPRKNGKSFLAAGIGLLFLTDPSEYGAEVYSGATSEKQAMEVFRPARLICERADWFKEEFGIEVRIKNLSIPASGGRFEPIVRNPGDGAGPSCAIVDEFHEHDSPDLIETMETGMGAREHPLLFVITTAGSNLGGPCYEKDLDAERILEGNVTDESIFVLLFEKDDADEWDSDEALIKANPNIDVSVSFDYLARQREKARRSASLQNAFRTKHLNEWVGARTAWMNMLAWRRAQREYTEEELLGQRCYITVDLASRKDLAAITATFKRGTNYYTLDWFFACEETIDQHPKLRDFREQGHLIETPGDATEYAFLEEQLLEIAGKFDVIGFGYDPWHAKYLMQRIEDQTSENLVLEFPTRIDRISPAMKELDACVAENQYHHNGHPVATWCIGNVMAKLDEKQNTFPAKDKKDSPNKIDGAITRIMGVGLWLEQPEPTSSVYESGAV